MKTNVELEQTGEANRAARVITRAAKKGQLLQPGTRNRECLTDKLAGMEQRQETKSEGSLNIAGKHALTLIK